MATIKVLESFPKELLLRKSEGRSLGVFRFVHVSDVPEPVLLRLRELARSLEAEMAVTGGEGLLIASSDQLRSLLSELQGDPDLVEVGVALREALATPTGDPKTPLLRREQDDYRLTDVADERSIPVPPGTTM